MSDDMVRKFALSLRKSAREAEEDGAVNVMAELSPRLAAKVARVLLAATRIVRKRKGGA